MIQAYTERVKKLSRYFNKAVLVSGIITVSFLTVLKVLHIPQYIFDSLLGDNIKEISDHIKEIMEIFFSGSLFFLIKLFIKGVVEDYMHLESKISMGPSKVLPLSQTFLERESGTPSKDPSSGGSSSGSPSSGNSSSGNSSSGSSSSNTLLQRRLARFPSSNTSAQYPYPEYLEAEVDKKKLLDSILKVRKELLELEEAPSKNEDIALRVAKKEMLEEKLKGLENR